MNNNPIPHKQYRAKIGSITCSADADIYDFHVDVWFRRECSGAINFCDEHYPDQVKFLKTEHINQQLFYKYINWYVEFQTQDAYIHFLLSNDVNKEGYI